MEKCANIILCSALFLCTSLFLYCVYSHIDTVDSGSKFYAACGAISLLCIAVIGIALRCGRDVKINFALLVCAAGLATYLTELILMAYVGNNFYLDIGKVIRATNFDRRAEIEVVKQLQSEGVEAFPTVYPIRFLDRDARLVLLAGVSLSTTVFCNENGQYTIYQSDEHGFNNPVGLYGERYIDIVVVGDSYAHGACVEPNQDIAAQLRRIGWKVINLGYSANGPLLELATLSEYAARLRPKVVLWLYFEGNDLRDLEEEKNSPLLLLYLDDNFNQNLITRQDEIDRILKNDILDRIEKESKITKKWFRVARLAHLRYRLGLFRSAAITQPDLLLFSKVLATAKQRVASWGGQIYFVYLPSFRKYTTTNANYDEQVRYKQVISIVNDLNIHLVNFRKVLDSHSDPLKFFPFKRDGHYNAEGYSMLAEAIKKDLVVSGSLR